MAYERAWLASNPKPRPEALQDSAIESRSLRNCGLGSVGMSALSPPTIDNRGRIVVGHSIGNACVRIDRRGHKSANINLRIRTTHNLPAVNVVAYDVC